MQFFLIFLLSCVAFLPAADRGSLYLVGYIPTHLDLRIQPVTGITDILDLEGGETNLKVATVSEISNSGTGYSVFMESVNAGRLLHSAGVQFSTYQIKYGAAAVAVTPPAVGSAVQVKSVGALPGLTVQLEDVFIDIPANANLGSGVYTDSLILSIQAL